MLAPQPTPLAPLNVADVRNIGLPRAPAQRHARGKPLDEALAEMERTAERVVTELAAEGKHARGKG